MEILRAARLGVAVWSAAELDVLTIEMLCGLVKDLNAKTRFTGLPVVPGDNAMGVLQVCGWTTGFPVRTSFARGYAEHDPWRFEAKRLLASGEADCALWISAYGGKPLDWPTDAKLIALCPVDEVFDQPPHVQIAIGRPGVDHDGVEYQAGAGTLRPVVATKPSDMPSVAAVLSAILAALPPEEAVPC
jgi:formylmethanofuran dehydrogenase subunit B